MAANFLATAFGDGQEIRSRLPWPPRLSISSSSASGSSRAALVAGAGNRWWHCSLSDVHRVLTVAYFDSLGIPRLT